MIQQFKGRNIIVIGWNSRTTAVMIYRFIFLLLALASVVVAVKLPLSWCIHLAKICDQFDDDCPSAPSLITFENCPKTLMDNCMPEMFLMPPVIIWSPLEQFSMVSVSCPKCTMLNVPNVPLHARGWRNGMGGPRSDPRKIYGIYGIVLLVCRVYGCSKSHEVLGYHPGIIKHIPACFVPFKLWHIAGFTIEHIQLVSSLLSLGMSIHKVHDILLQRIGWWYHRQKVKFMELDKKSKDLFPSQKEWLESYSSFLPSNHSISSCFLADFWEKEDVYVKVMQNTTIGEEDSWLSCDHTFASASKQYD